MSRRRQTSELFTGETLDTVNRRGWRQPARPSGMQAEDGDIGRRRRQTDAIAPTMGRQSLDHEVELLSVILEQPVAAEKSLPTPFAGNPRLTSLGRLPLPAREQLAQLHHEMVSLPQAA